MNPFLEQEDVWTDFHDTFLPAVREALVAQVRPNYIVKIEEYLFIHEPSAEQRLLMGHADVSVARPSGTAETASGTATLSSPAMIRLPTVDIEKHLYLEIRDRNNRELVTVVEMLSPSNKTPGPNREQYLAKRGNLLLSTAHFVEIDLLRGWPRMPMEKAGVCDYCIIVSRVQDRPDANFWPLNLSDPLPKIPIPLRSPHADAELDPQAILHRVYDSAAYEEYIYKGTPNPPLRAEDAVWAAFLIPS
jgi:hypothetical protein